MIKADVISLLKQNKGFINFPNPLPVKGPKKSVTSIDLHEGQVRVYHESGVTNIDWCESEIIEVISEYLKNLADESNKTYPEAAGDI